ncbi:ATP-binding protein [Streptomyces venezuelae]|uniref:ATP-binding protein n=1 Tax=Streptomyces venezuelae TaxID=54571 RepID=UPI00344976EC
MSRSPCPSRARRWFRTFTASYDLTCSIEDFPADVRRRDPDADDAHGRGLLLVDALSDSWRAGPSRFGGTVVSFRVDAAWKPS